MCTWASISAGMSVPPVVSMTGPGMAGELADRLDRDDALALDQHAHALEQARAVEQ